MPCNLYGPNDNYNLHRSHVLPALIRKLHDAKDNKSATVSIWGSGNVEREFLFVDELANACLPLVFDSSKPDGTPKKCLDVSLMTSLGWSNSLSLKEGIQKTYLDFITNHSKYISK